MTLRTPSSVLLACALVVSGCELNPLRKNIGIDLSRVAGFAIGVPPAVESSTRALHSGTHTGTEHEVLYSINDDGTMSVVDLTEGSSDEITPLAVFDTPNYVVFGYWRVSYQGVPCHVIPVRKADGAMFCVPANFSGGTDYGIPVADLQVEPDSTGETLYVLHNPGLAKVEMAANDATKTALIKNPNDDPHNPQATGETASAIAVNARDEVAAFVELSGDGVSTGTVRLYRADGTLQAFATKGYGCLTAGVPGDDDSFYYLGEKDGQAGVFKVARQSDGTFTHGLYASPPAGTFSQTSCRIIHRTADRIFGAFRHTASLVELYNPEGQVTVTTVADAPASVLWQVAHGQDIYFAGVTNQNFVVTAYDIETRLSSVRVNTDAYAAVTALDIGADGAISFTARRIADNQKILATLPADSNVIQEQVLAADAPTVTLIKRIE